MSQEGSADYSRASHMLQKLLYVLPLEQKRSLILQMGLVQSTAVRSEAYQLPTYSISACS